MLTLYDLDQQRRDRERAEARSLRTEVDRWKQQSWDDAQEILRLNERILELEWDVSTLKGERDMAIAAAVMDERQKLVGLSS